MEIASPETIQDLAASLAAAASGGKRIRLGGNFTKDHMGGLPGPADVTLSTAGLRRVLQYEPRDLTLSVEAGLPYAELALLLAQDRLMLPLDPPFGETATVGGVVATNLSGPRRRLYGTARDLIIGMKFVTLEGKIVQSGGMVVKNAAGLDMAKLLIGSFGTLAAIAAVNFKLAPIPRASRTFAMAFDSLPAAISARDRILKSVLQPAAVDLFNPPAAAMLGRQGYLLLVEAGGNPAVLDRYARELDPADSLESESAQSLWKSVCEFTPRFLDQNRQGVVVRVASTLSGLQPVLEGAAVPVVARAGSGVCWLHFPVAAAADPWLREAANRGWKVMVDFAPPELKQSMDLWPKPGPDLELMKRVKHMFDPHSLLNPGRLYGRI